MELSGNASESHPPERDNSVAGIYGKEVAFAEVRQFGIDFVSSLHNSKLTRGKNEEYAKETRCIKK